MPLEVLERKIAHLIIKRAQLHGNDAAQDNINKQLTKLYDVKRIMLSQRARGVCKC